MILYFSLRGLVENHKSQNCDIFPCFMSTYWMLKCWFKFNPRMIESSLVKGYLNN